MLVHAEKRLRQLMVLRAIALGLASGDMGGTRSIKRRRALVSPSEDCLILYPTFGERSP
jgi:hypothetical protein